jgi:hypothetical protein
VRGDPAIAELADIVEQFRPITPSIGVTWKHVLDVAAADQELPRFYWSPLYNAAMGYHYAWLDDCFCVLKRKWVVASPVCDLMLAPIHREGDHAREHRLAERILKAGIGIRVCEADGYAVAVWQHAEYVYDGGELSKRQRYFTRRAARSRLGIAAYGDADTLLRVWAEQTGGPRRTIGSVLRACDEWPVDRRYLVDEGSGVTYGLTTLEHLTGEHYAIPARISRRDAPSRGIAHVLHGSDRVVAGEGTLLAFGADLHTHRDTVAHKEQLSPIGFNRIGRLKPRKISAEEWRHARPGGAPTQTELRLDV